MKKFTLTYATLLTFLSVAAAFGPASAASDEVSILPVLEEDTVAETPPFIEESEVSIMPVGDDEVVALKKEVIEEPEGPEVVALEEEVVADRPLVLGDLVPGLRQFPEKYGQKPLPHSNHPLGAFENWGRFIKQKVWGNQS